MPFSWEEAAFMSYSSGFGACYVEKSVSTDCTPPAHPINTEYQWHKCAGQAPRHFSSSAVKKMPPWTDAVPSTLMRDPGSLHWKLHPSGINCLPDCLKNQKAYNNVVCLLSCYHSDFGVWGSGAFCLLHFWFGVLFFCLLWFFACLLFTFFSFNRNKWGIVTFGDNQAKLYSGSQTLSRISPGPGSLLELGVAEKHTYDTSGGSFKWTKHPRKITFRNPKQLLSNYTNNTSVLQISRAASINNQ